MICEHLSHFEGLNFCAIASQWADGLPVAVTDAACKVCQTCANPKQFNRVTVSLGQSKLRRDNLESHDRKIPDSIQYLAEVKASEAVKRYVDSTVQWISDGRPVRTDAEVFAILKICQSCEEFQNESCKLCGCNINESGGWTNKARRTNEHCPKGHW